MLQVGTGMCVGEVGVCWIPGWGDVLRSLDCVKLVGTWSFLYYYQCVFIVQTRFHYDIFESYILLIHPFTLLDLTSCTGLWIVPLLVLCLTYFIKNSRFCICEKAYFVSV